MRYLRADVVNGLIITGLLDHPPLTRKRKEGLMRHYSGNGPLRNGLLALLAAIVLLVFSSGPSEARLVFHRSEDICDGTVCQKMPDDVYVISDGGIGLTNLTNDPGTTADDDYYDTWPGISPYGRIAFWSNRSGSYEVYVANLGDSGLTDLRRVTSLNFSRSPAGSRPVWSPDNLELIFSNYDAGGRWHVYRVNADGSGLSEILTSQAGVAYKTRSWSRDKSRILLDIIDTSVGMTGVAEYDVNENIFRYLTGDRQGFSDGVSQYDADYSFDGKYIIFMGARTRRGTTCT